MMKFNVWFTIRGPAGQVEAPNNTNPIESANLASLLSMLSTNLPSPFGLAETVGIRVEAAEDD